MDTQIILMYCLCDDLLLDPARDFTIPSFRKLGVSWKISGPSHHRVGRVSETDLQDAALSHVESEHAPSSMSQVPAGDPA